MAATLPETHPFRMLAAAVADRPVGISYLTEAGAPAWSDGERIFLSAERLAGEGGRELLVQCCLLAGGSLAGLGLRSLIGSIEARQRFLLLEVERCSALIADRLPVALLAAVIVSGHPLAGRCQVSERTHGGVSGRL